MYIRNYTYIILYIHVYKPNVIVSFVSDTRTTQIDSEDLYGNTHLSSKPCVRNLSRLIVTYPVSFTGNPYTAYYRTLDPLLIYDLIMPFRPRSDKFDRR